MEQTARIFFTAFIINVEVIEHQKGRHGSPKRENHDGLFCFSKDDFTYLREINCHILDLKNFPVSVDAGNRTGDPQALLCKATVKDHSNLLSLMQLGNHLCDSVFHKLSPSCAAGGSLQYPGYNGTGHR